MAPLVSVVLPTRNRARTLGRAIRSVLTQTMGDLELIVVDDGSTDDTACQLATIGDARLRVIRIACANAGAARNAGIAAARAPVIAFQDSDDEWMALKLERQLAALSEDATADLVYSAVLRWDGVRVLRLPSARHEPGPQPSLGALVRRRDIVSTPAWLVRRECLERVGPFDESLPAVEDWEWLLRFAATGQARFLDEPLVIVNESEDSLSMRHDRVARALMMIAEKHRAQLRQEGRGVLARIHLAAGARACLGADVAAGRSAFARGLAEQPFALPLVGAWLLSFAGPGPMQAAWRYARRRLAQ